MSQSPLCAQMCQDDNLYLFPIHWIQSLSEDMISVMNICFLLFIRREYTEKLLLMFWAGMEGYVVEIIDINDNQGFPMKQGVLTDGSIG